MPLPNFTTQISPLAVCANSEKIPTKILSHLFLPGDSKLSDVSHGEFPTLLAKRAFLKRSRQKLKNLLNDPRRDTFPRYQKGESIRIKLSGSNIHRQATVMSDSDEFMTSVFPDVQVHTPRT